MSGMVYSKFFWSDWRSDPKLRTCSYAARGLWMEMLCIMHEEGGYLLVAGKKVDDAVTLARLTGGVAEEDVRALLSELRENGVLSVDRRGVIYSRRMVRDEKMRSKNRDNGKLGGNPKLLRQREIFDPLKHQANPQNPESRIQKPDSKEKIQKEKLAAPDVTPDDGWPSDHLELFWTAFPPYRRESKRKVGEKLCQLRRDKIVSWETLIGAVRRFAETNPDKFASAPMVWLNQERWDREYGPAMADGNGNYRNGGGQRRHGFAALAARVRRESAERERADPVAPSEDTLFDAAGAAHLYDRSKPN